MKYKKSDLMEYEEFLCKQYKILIDEEELNSQEENIEELIDIKIKDVVKILLENFDGFRIHGWGNYITKNIEEAKKFFYDSDTLKLLQDKTSKFYEKDTSYIYNCFKDEVEHGAVIQREYLYLKRTLDKLKELKKMPTREKEIKEYENYLDKKFETHLASRKEEQECREKRREESAYSNDEEAILQIMKDNEIDRFVAEDIFYKYDTIESVKKSINDKAEKIILMLMKDTGFTKEESENLLYKSIVYKSLQDIETMIYDEMPYYLYELLQDEMKYDSIVFPRYMS